MASSSRTYDEPDRREPLIRQSGRQQEGSGGALFPPRGFADSSFNRNLQLRWLNHFSATSCKAFFLYTDNSKSERGHCIFICSERSTPVCHVSMSLGISQRNEAATLRLHLVSSEMVLRSKAFAIERQGPSLETGLVGRGRGPRGEIATPRAFEPGFSSCPAPAEPVVVRAYSY